MKTKKAALSLINSTSSSPAHASASPERFVSVEIAAEFLSLSPRYILDRARNGTLPGYPLETGARTVWRFRLSALEAAMERLGSPTMVYPNDSTSYGTKPAKSVAGSE